MFNNGSTLFASEGTFMVLTFLPIILYILLAGFGIYFIIKVIRFMNAKTKSDQQRNELINELIKTVSEGRSIK